MNSIKNWQKDNYHKQMMQLKEKKEMEEQFKKAQKPWAKLLEKVDKCKVRFDYQQDQLLIPFSCPDKLPHGLQERKDCSEPRKKRHQGFQSVSGSGVIGKCGTKSSQWNNCKVDKLICSRSALTDGSQFNEISSWSLLLAFYFWSTLSGDELGFLGDTGHLSCFPWTADIEVEGSTC